MKTKLHKEQKEFNYNKKLQRLLSAHVETFRNSTKKPKLVLAGNSYQRNLRRRKKCFNKMKNISASETLRQKIQKQNLKLHCSRPMSRDKGGVDKSNPVVFFQLLQRFTKRLTIQGMRSVRNQKYSWISAADICKAELDWIRRKYLLVCTQFQ